MSDEQSPNTPLRDDLNMVLSLAAQKINETYSDDHEYGRRWERVRDALYDMQADNYGYYVIYTNEKKDSN